MIIQVKNLSKTYKVKKKSGVFREMFFPKFKAVHAVDDLSFSIEKGESVAFLGPNGAGKTTTLKMLSGLIYPDSGEIDVLGHFPFSRNEAYLRNIGLVMGNKTALEWDLSPHQNFELLRRIYEIGINTYRKRIQNLTQLLDVGNLVDVQVRKLSLGERMKMELIGSILHNPEVIFLDEPTIGLDVISKQKVRKFLKEIQKESDITILLTSHDMSDVVKICDRVMVINRGKLIYDNALSTLQEKYKKERFVKFIFRKLPEEEKIGHYAEVNEKGENFYVLKTSNENMPDLLKKVTTYFKLEDIDILSVPLDEIIADLFENGET